MQRYRRPSSVLQPQSFNPLFIGSKDATHVEEVHVRYVFVVSIPFSSGQRMQLDEADGGAIHGNRLSIPFSSGQRMQPQTYRHSPQN